MERAFLISPHSFVLDYWVRLGAPAGMTFVPRALPYGLSPDIKVSSDMAGSVCALDGCLPAAVIERFLVRFKAETPEVRAVLVVDEIAHAVAFPLLRQGLRGMLTYAQAAVQLRPAVEAVGRGGMWMPRESLTAFLGNLLDLRRPAAALVPPGGLSVSRREADVLDGLLENLSNKEIGVRLNISERTVKFHVSNLLAKFSVERRADLILRSVHAINLAPMGPN